MLLDQTKILANDPNFGNVSVCAGGVVHINLSHVTLKFVPEDCLRFSELVAKARLAAQELSHEEVAKPRLRIVQPDPDGEEETDGDRPS